MKGKYTLKTMVNPEKEKFVSGPSVESQQIVSQNFRPENIQVTNIGAEIPPELQKIESQIVAGPMVTTRHDVNATLGLETVAKPTAPETTEKMPELPDAKNLLRELEKLNPKEQDALIAKLAGKRVYRFNKEGKREYVSLGFQKKADGTWDLGNISLTTYDERGATSQSKKIQKPDAITYRHWQRPKAEKLPNIGDGVIYRDPAGKILKGTYAGMDESGTITLKVGKDTISLQADNLLKYENNGKTAFALRVPGRPIPTEAVAPKIPPDKPVPATPSYPEGSAAAAPKPQPDTAAGIESGKVAGDARPAAPAEDPKKTFTKEIGEIPNLLPEQKEKILAAAEKLSEKLGEKPKGSKETSPAPAATPAAPGEAASSLPPSPSWGEVWKDEWNRNENWKSRNIGIGTTVTGAVIGTFVAPIVGTAVGAAVGYGIHRLARVGAAAVGTLVTKVKDYWSRFKAGWNALTGKTPTGTGKPAAKPAAAPVAPPAVSRKSEESAPKPAAARQEPNRAAREPKPQPKAKSVPEKMPTAGPIDWSVFKGQEWQGITFNLQQLERAWNERGEVAVQHITSIKQTTKPPQAKKELATKLLTDPKCNDKPWAQQLAKELGFVPKKRNAAPSP